MNNLETIKLYFDKRMKRIFLFGFISGFPWVLIGSALSLWLKENDLSRSTIGWAGLIFGVYAINFLWAPLVDRLKIPFLSKSIGHRKSWIITMQSIILISLIFWSLLEPNENLWLIIFVGLAIAVSSATQDITIDALRIEQINENEGKTMAAGAAIQVVGWWTGYKIGGVISLMTAEFFQQKGFENYWQLSFLILGLIILFSSLALFFVPEQSSDSKELNQKINDEKLYEKFKLKNNFTKFFAWLYGTVVSPLISFFKKNSTSVAIGLLSFIFLFKIGEAFLGRMSIIFYKELGFSKNGYSFIL